MYTHLDARSPAVGSVGEFPGLVDRACVRVCVSVCICVSLFRSERCSNRVVEAPLGAKRVRVASGARQAIASPTYRTMRT